MKYLLYSLLGFILFVSACKKDDVKPVANNPNDTVKADSAGCNFTITTRTAKDSTGKMPFLKGSFSKGFLYILFGYNGLPNPKPGLAINLQGVAADSAPITVDRHTPFTKTASASYSVVKRQYDRSYTGETTRALSDLTVTVTKWQPHWVEGYFSGTLVDATYGGDTVRITRCDFKARY